MLAVSCNCGSSPGYTVPIRVTCKCIPNPDAFGRGAGFFGPNCCLTCYNKFKEEQTKNTRHDPRVQYHRLYPIYHFLDLDQKMKVRQYVEYRAEFKKIESLAKFRTATQMEERKMDLERRAERLRRIMEDEMFTYSKHITDEFEAAKESKIDAMRQRVAELRQKREIEDRKIVDAKLEQAFQNSCEQLRTLRVKKMAREMPKDWEEQIRMKQRLECEQEENDRMYAYLNLKDAENKYKMEMAYDCARKEAFRKEIEELDRQLEYKRQQQALTGGIVAKEVAANNKVLAEIAEEERQLLEEKKARFIRAKEHVKDMMATRDYYKTRKLKREEIVAVEFLKKAVRELYVEQEDRSKAKKELARAIDIYKEYLKNRDCLANSRDMELIKIIDNVIEEQYQKTMASRRREQAQRRQLFCDVMKGRGEQMEALRQQREQEAIEAKIAVEKLKADWKKYLQELEAEKAKKAEKQRQYRQALDCQTQYKNIRDDRDYKEFWRQEELGCMQETFFQEKLRKTVYETKDVQSNPFRDPLVGKHIKQCLRPV